MTATISLDFIRRIVLCGLFLASGWTLAPSLHVAAQALPNGGVPVGAPPPTRPSDPTDLSELLTKIHLRARYVLDYFRTRVEANLVYFFIVLAGFVSTFTIGSGYFNVVRRANGFSGDIFWWCGRIVVCLILIYGSLELISEAAIIGRTIASGSNDNPSYLGALLLEQQHQFNDNFSRFQFNSFLIKVDDTVIWINPNPTPGGETYLSILEPKETSAKDLVEGKIDTQNWSILNALRALRVSRFILELADFALMYLNFYLFIAVRLFAPLAAAFAIDRTFAQRISIPFAWGAGVITLGLPILSQVVRLLAYMFGNLCLYAAMPEKPLYVFDHAAMIAVGNGSNPIVTCYLLAVSTTLCALILFISPYLAFRFSKGEVLEAVSNTVQSWMTAGGSLAVSTVGAHYAAALNQQAQATQIQGQAAASVREAEAGRAADKVGAAAVWQQTINQIHAKSDQERSAIGGRLAGAVINAGAERANTVAVARAVNNQAFLHLEGNAVKERISNDAHARFGIAQSLGQRGHADNTAKIHAITSLAPKIGYGTGQGENSPGPQASFHLEAQPLVDGILAKSGYSPASAQHELNVRAYEEQRQSLNDGVGWQQTIVGDADNQYLTDVTQAANDQYAGRVSAAQAEAGGALAGVNQAERMEISGADDKHAADRQAIDLRADGRLQAVEIQSQAGLDAAELTKQAALASHLSEQVSAVIRHTSESFRF